MRTTSWKLKTIIIFVTLAFVACGGGESNNDTTDTGLTDDAGTEDVSTEDIGGGEDTDGDEDAGGADAACTPEEVAAEQVAVNTSVNDGSVTFGTDGDVQTATIDAASGGTQNAANESFIYIDLDNGQKLELSDEEAFEDTDWDLAFRRTVIRLNGADSGPGAWMAARVDADWETATPPSASGGAWGEDDFVSDTCEVLTGAGDRGLATAFDGWYSYDPSTHQVSAPEETTWFLYEAMTHAVLKLSIDSYSDATYEIRWGSN